MSDTPRTRGFALVVAGESNASRFARKGHALGAQYCRECSRQEAIAMSRKAAELRMRQAAQDREARILRARVRWRLQRLGLPEQ